MIDEYFWGAILRVTQAAIQATPTVLIGLILVGIFQRLVGRENTRRLFGDGSRTSLLRAWVIGMLLPVCSLGVIPVMREMRRAGISGGTILAFGLTAPLFNPISVLYGLTLADPVVIIVFCFCSLVIVTVVGVAWDRLFPGTAQAEPNLPAVSYGWRRICAVVVAAARELASRGSLYIAIGLLGVAGLSVVLPHGSLQTSAESDNVWAPLFMTAVAIPVYATPMTAMVQLASMFQHGNSVGAAFALLALGAGANLGIVWWMVRQYGVRPSLAWFLILCGVVVGLAYLVDKPLYPKGVDPPGHTHAFDIYCCPFGQPAPSPAAYVWKTLSEDIAPHELVSLGIFLALTTLAVALTRADPQHRVERWLEQSRREPSSMDFVIPNTALAGIALVGLIALSVLGCYIYYPAPSEIFEEMRLINTEVVSAATSKDWESAAYWIPIYDDWTRKLQVSVYLRQGQLSRYHRMKANVFRDKLELLEHVVEDRAADEVRDYAMAVNQAYRRLRMAYLE
jgi:uncharacterized membrane protein YraQ (UPF0718 family)